MRKLMPLAYQALSDWHTVATRTGADAGLEPLLVELVKIRASQVNGCAFCLDMHVHEARERGVPDELYNRVAQDFTHEQIAALVMAIAVINAWNRLGVASGATPPHRP